jgi:hypothetical protein
MPKKRFSAEQIIVVLRQIEVLISQGKTPAVACRETEISQQSYYLMEGRPTYCNSQIVASAHFVSRKIEQNPTISLRCSAHRRQIWLVRRFSGRIIKPHTSWYS